MCLFLLGTAMDLATKIAAKSPVAVAATKDILNFSANHSIEDGLRYTQAVNSAALQTEVGPRDSKARRLVSVI